MKLGFLQAIKSKTILSFVGIILMNGLNVMAADPQSMIAALHLDPQWQIVANGIVAAYGIYGRMRPVQGVPPTAK